MSRASHERTSKPRPELSGETGIRAVLEAAAAHPEELPALSPFLAARAIAAARAQAARGPLEFVAPVAWHALPVLAALLVVLGLWAGFEVGRDAEAQEEVAMVVLSSRDSGPDAPLTTLLLPGPTESPARGGPR